jgi:hypothetical protein
MNENQAVFVVPTFKGRIAHSSGTFQRLRTIRGSIVDSINSPLSDSCRDYVGPSALPCCAGFRRQNKVKIFARCSVVTGRARWTGLMPKSGGRVFLEASKL